MKFYKRIMAAIVVSLMIILSFIPANASYMPKGTDNSNGAKNILLVYSGYYNPSAYGQQEGTWNEDKFMPYVAHLNQKGQPDDTFFDTFLFLGISTPYGGSTQRYYNWEGNTTHPGQKQDWQWYLDRLFTKNQQLDALNETVKKVDKRIKIDDHKVLVYIMLPFADPNSTNFGDIDGSGSLNLSSLASREKAIKWYIDQFTKRFKAENYKYLKLGGFYWMQEDLDPSVSGEVDSVKFTSDYLHNLGLKLGWIPYSGAYLKSEGNKYGFDWTLIQPNHYFDDSSTYKRITDTANLANASNEGVEIEFDERVLSDKWYKQALMDYLIGGIEYGYMENSLIAYYQDVYGLYDLYYSKNPLGKKLYDEVYKFSKCEYQALLGNIKGKVVDMHGNPIKGIEVSNGMKSSITNSNGEYELDNLYGTGQDISAKDVLNKVYKPITFTVNIKPNQTIIKDLVLKSGILYGKVGGTVDNSVYSNLSQGIIPTVTMTGSNTDSQELERERSIISRLTDGVYARGYWDSDRYNYVDFYGNNGRSLIINLGRTCTVNEIGLRVTKDVSSGINLPSNVDISISNDNGSTWSYLGSISSDMATVINSNNGFYEYHLGGLNFQADQVKITFPVRTWAFIDELKIMGSKGIAKGSTPPPSDTNEKVPNYSMKIEPNIDTFSIDQNGKATVEDLNNLDSNGNPISIKNAEFSTSNPSVVRINSNGIFTALNKGSAMIYAKVNGIEVESSLINVSDAESVPTTLIMDQKNITLNKGDKKVVNVVVYDQYNKVMNHVHLDWTSNDPSIVKVNNKGEIKAMKSGKAAIYAIFNSYTRAQVDVTVK